MIWWIGLLFVAGMVLVLAEFMLPGVILGVAGAVLLVVCAMLGFAYYPEYAIFLLIAEIVGVAVTIGLGMYLMANTSLGKSLRLDTSQSVEEGYVNQASDLSLIGKIGEAKTPLRPAGTIVVDGVRHDVVTDGTMIDRGVRVRVVEVRGNRIVVEKAE